MLNYKDTIITILDGGLGNKFNGLFQGIHLSNILNKNLVVNNVRNHSTDFDLRLLFDFNYEYIENTLTELDRKLDSNIPIYAHRNDVNYKRKVYINNTNYNDSSFAFLTNAIYVSPQDLIRCYGKVKINKQIFDKVYDFIIANKINKETLGLHIRASDFPKRNDNIQYAKEFIKNNSNKQIFVCTDEKEVEDSINHHKNLIFYKKQHYTEKYDKSSGWNGAIVDNDNRMWNYNAARNEQSMIEAFIEMLILSKTTSHGNPRSSFLGWAKRFESSGLI